MLYLSSVQYDSALKSKDTNIVLESEPETVQSGVGGVYRLFII